jgi:hypothetical protein
MARHTKTGRSKGKGPFLMLTDWMMNSAAWCSLTAADRAVYIEVARLYNGRNNGFLALGARAAAERVNINKDTAGRCFARLIDRGFIECAHPGGFNTNARRATEWRLTAEKCDRTHELPSKAFMRWRPENLDHRPKRGPHKSETRGQEPPQTGPQVPRFRTYAGGLASD